MKKYLAIFAILITVLSACKKDNTNNKTTEEQAAADEAIIKEYLESHHITAIKDPSGLYYKIDEPGTGITPSATSSITVSYTGKFTNDTPFESNSGITFPLNGVIRGWQTGIPKIKSGGTIQLFIPSALGYGTAGKGSIPPNTVLIFTITVLSVNS